MTLEDVVVGVVSATHAVRDSIASAISAAGASASACTEATAISGGAAVDVIVFDVDGAPEHLVPVALALAGDDRTRQAPRVLVVAGEVSAARVAPFGAAVIVPSTSSDEVIAGAVAGAVAQVRARNESARRVEESAAEQRGTVQHLQKLAKEAGTLAHDARVLFGVILGFASNLRDGMAGPVSETQRDNAIAIAEASTDAAALVERFVTTARSAAERGASREGLALLPPRQPHRRRLTDLGDLVRTTVILLGGVAAAKAIRVTTEVARAVRPAWCDPIQIKQALVNLLSNALKFTPAGGSVEVAVRQGPPSSARGGATLRRQIEIVVRDSGPGIPVSQREHVFERGVRLERDRDSPGTGIGLSVVRDVVEQHGGVVKIEDVPEGGTCVVITLPADLRSRASDSPRAPLQGGCEGSE